MSMIHLQRPHFSRTASYGIPCYCNLQRLSKLSSNYTSSKKMEKELSEKLDKPSISEFNKYSSTSNIKFDRLQQTDVTGDRVEFGQFVSREAQLDEEYWTAAWLRAESHWEDRPNDRYSDNYKRRFAEQEFYSLKQRCNAQLENCTCIVTVKKEDKNVKRTVLKSVVGTLDLNVRYLSHGQTFPGEQIKGSPFNFCLINRKSSSRYGYIANVCVAKSARRQGIAKNMLQFALKMAKAHGADKVFVHVHRHNEAAKDLYQKLGFKVVDAESSQVSPDQTYLLCFQD